MTPSGENWVTLDTAAPGYASRCAATSPAPTPSGAARSAWPLRRPRPGAVRGPPAGAAAPSGAPAPVRGRPAETRRRSEASGPRVARPAISRYPPKAGLSAATPRAPTPYRPGGLSGQITCQNRADTSLVNNRRRSLEEISSLEDMRNTVGIQADEAPADVPVAFRVRHAQPASMETPASGGNSILHEKLAVPVGLRAPGLAVPARHPSRPPRAGWDALPRWCHPNQKMRPPGRLN
jgi:hypothetical protein